MPKLNQYAKSEVKRVKAHKKQIRQFLIDDLRANFGQTYLGLPLSDPKAVTKVCEANEVEQEQIWYDSVDVDIDNPDYSIYDNYLLSGYYTWDGWTHQSTANVIGFLKHIGYQPKKILDFGAGSGASTVELALAFPNSTVMYSNVESLQSKVAKELAAHMGVTNINFVDETDWPAISDCDVVVAFEVFEHLREPTSTLRKLVLDNPDCKVYADGSSFSIRALGHFPTYKTEVGEIVKGKSFKRHFNKAIRAAGFLSAEKSLDDWEEKFWNNRPAIFVRNM